MADKLPIPPLWTNTLDLTTATLPPGKTALGNEVLTGGSGGGVSSVTATAPIASSGGTTPNISLDNSTVTPGTYGDSGNVGQFTVDAHGLLQFAGNVPITGFASSTLTNAHIFVGNGSNVATDVAMSGDATIANTGAVQVNRITFNVNQTAHGFVVGNVITEGTSSWAKSINSTSTLVADAIVCTVTDADNFVAQQFGTLTLTTGQWDAVCGTSGGLTQGHYYWTDSTAGKMTSTQPTMSSTVFQQVCIKALSTTVAEVLLPVDAFITGSTLTNCFFGTASGTNTYTVTTTPSHGSYVVNDLLIIKFTNANTGASTLNDTSLGARTIQYNGAALVGGEIRANSTWILRDDGTNLQMTDFTLKSFTAGSVLFADSSGQVGQDNANIFWDDTNDRLGVGTAAPDQAVHVKGSSTTGGGVKVETTSTSSAVTNTSGYSLYYNTSGQIGTVGVHTTGYSNPGTIFLASQMTIESYGTGGMTMNAWGTGGDVIFATANGGATANERFRISSAGNVSVGAAALATTATDGFLYIPTCAGPPTGVPTTVTGRVPMIYDTTNNNLYIRNGGTWKKTTTFT